MKSTSESRPGADAPADLTDPWRARTLRAAAIEFGDKGHGQNRAHEFTASAIEAFDRIRQRRF